MGYHCAIEFPCGVLLFYCCKYPTTYGVRVHTVLCKVYTEDLHCSPLLFPLLLDLNFFRHLPLDLYTFFNRGHLLTITTNRGPIVPLCYKSSVYPLDTLTHTRSFTYTVWTFFCSRVLQKIKFFKPLLFPLKIVFGADFVSVFPLITYQNASFLRKLRISHSWKHCVDVCKSTQCFKFLHCVDIFCSQVQTCYVTQIIHPHTQKYICVSHKNW